MDKTWPSSCSGEASPMSSPSTTREAVTQQRGSVLTDMGPGASADRASRGRIQIRRDSKRQCAVWKWCWLKTVLGNTLETKSAHVLSTPPRYAICKTAGNRSAKRKIFAREIGSSRANAS